MSGEETKPDTTGTDTGEETPVPPLLRFVMLFKDLAKPTNLFVIAGLLVVGMVALTGGLKQVDTAEKELPTAQPSVTATAGPLAVWFKSAKWTDKTLIPLLSLKPGERYLIVSVEVTNQFRLPVGAPVLKESFRIDATNLLDSLGSPVTAAKADPVVVRISDSVSGAAVQPGLTMPLALAWKQDAKAAELPKSVTITINSHVWRASSLDGHEFWADSTPALTITLPLTEYT